MLILECLPDNHPLRNIPLGEIGAECREFVNKTWKPVETWNIRKNTYNQLKGSWIECCSFRAMEKE